MEEELLELDARLALRDRDHTLMALDRREARDLHRIDEADEDAALLCLLDELGDRTGLRAALVRDEEALHHAACADRLEHCVRAGDRHPRHVRRRGLSAGYRGRADERITVLLTTR